MRKILLICAAGLTLSGCYTTQGRYAGTGALVGGATGAAIGGLASGRGSGAVAGGVIGAATGALIGAAAAPKECYVRNSAGKLVRVRC